MAQECYINIFNHCIDYALKYSSSMKKETKDEFRVNLCRAKLDIAAMLDKGDGKHVK